MAYPLWHPASREAAPLVLPVEEFRRHFPGESRHVEFKQGASADRIARAVAAFSNTDGGVLLVGVGPDGLPVGTSTDGEALARLHRMVAAVHDGGRYDIAPVSIGDRSVTVIAVARRRQGFAQTADGQVVVRRDAMNVTLMGAQLAEFVTRNMLDRFETTPIDIDRSAADPALLGRLVTAFGWSDEVEDRLVEKGLAVWAGDAVRLTVAGALHLLRRPDRLLGKTLVEVFRYRDDAAAVEDKREAITGALADQVEAATRWVLDEIGKDVVVVGLRRYELERLPLRVLREAVANAVAHRVYEDNRRSVRIELRPTSVRIVSPGPLPEPVTVENMREQNAARNVAVIAVLRRLRLAEDAGRGVDLMQDLMAEHLLDAPRFAADEVSVSVELPLVSTVTSEERAWVAEVESRGDLKPHDRVLVVHAARGRILTNTSARELLAVDSTQARSALRRLCEAGLLVREGTRSDTRYTLAPDLSPPAGLRLSRADMRHAVLELTRDAPVTNQLVRERLAIDRVEALRVLNDLVEEGVLVRLGERRGARYVLSGSGGGEERPRYPRGR